MCDLLYLLKRPTCVAAYFPLNIKNVCISETYRPNEMVKENTTNRNNSKIKYQFVLN